jgi:hypothetical protein
MVFVVYTTITAFTTTTAIIPLYTVITNATVANFVSLSSPSFSAYFDTRVY